MIEPGPPDPQQPRYLEYRGPSDGKSKMTGGQIALGFVCWVISVAAAFAAGTAANSVPLGCIAFFAVIIPLSIYFRGRRAYRGFFPGVVIGAALTCLLPLGIVAALCWGK